MEPIQIEIEPWQMKDNRRAGGSGNLQWLYRFGNGYGASVVQGPYSYGGPDGLYELAVIKFDSHGEWELAYETPVTGDVLGYLSVDDVAAALAGIAALEA